MINEAFGQGWLQCCAVGISLVRPDVPVRGGLAF